MGRLGDADGVLALTNDGATHGTGSDPNRPHWPRIRTIHAWFTAEKVTAVRSFARRVPGPLAHGPKMRIRNRIDVCFKHWPAARIKISLKLVHAAVNR
jgi:hypothetical protein